MVVVIYFHVLTEDGSFAYCHLVHGIYVAIVVKENIIMQASSPNASESPDLKGIEGDSLSPKKGSFGDVFSRDNSDIQSRFHLYKAYEGTLLHPVIIG